MSKANPPRTAQRHYTVASAVTNLRPPAGG